MPTLYLEINEELTEGELQTKQPLTVRVEVTGKDDALKKLLIFETFFEGREYSKKLHTHNHDIPKTACTDEVL